MELISSKYRRAILLGAIMAVIITAAVVSSTFLISPRISAQTPLSGSGTQSQLIVELTDPPNVPLGTTSLNLTYSLMDLLVTGPDGATKAVTIIPGRDAMTVDLLKLDNVSKTLALSTVPRGSTVTLVTFVVSKIAIEINGTNFPVTLATGGNELQLSLSNASAIQNNRTVLLLELDPTVISTSGNYELVSSSAGIIKPESEVGPQEASVGQLQQLSYYDQGELRLTHGKISAVLSSLVVNGNVTKMNIEVTNTGSIPERLILFGIHGDFEWTACPSAGQESSRYFTNVCNGGPNEVLLIPGEPHVASNATIVSDCAPRHMSLVNPPDIQNDLNNPIVMNPGQCLAFSFSGTIHLGSHAIVPSTGEGQEFTVRVFASNGVEVKFGCVLQDRDFSSPKCTVES